MVSEPAMWAAVSDVCAMMVNTAVSVCVAG